MADDAEPAVSDKMACPACSAYTSTVLAAYADGEDCPHCGLSAGATEELLAARRRGADAALTEAYAAAVIRADHAEAEARRLREQIRRVREALRDPE